MEEVEIRRGIYVGPTHLGDTIRLRVYTDKAHLTVSEAKALRKVLKSFIKETENATS